MGRISKGEKQFVSAFFNIKAMKRAWRALYTYKFRISVLQRLDALEGEIKKLKEEK